VKSKESRLQKIVRDTIEIVKLEELMELLEKKEKPSSYWGIAPTGPPHIGYYRAIAKQRDFIDAGLKHIILIADIHAALDDQKAPWDEIELRSSIYEIALKKLGLNENVKYIRGSSFQKSEEYVSKLYKLLTFVTVKRATRAASEVCRMKNPKVSELVYPVMQNLDFLELDVDIAYGGIDQRHIYMMGREVLPKIGFQRPLISIFTPPGLSLKGKEKMSASKKEGRLEVYAPAEEIKNKISLAYCPPKTLEGNPVIELCKYFIFPRVSEFKIERSRKFGSDICFKEFSELEKTYLSGGIHPMDLKNAVIKYLIDILKPVREYFEKHSDMLKVFEKE